MKARSMENTPSILLSMFQKLYAATIDRSKFREVVSRLIVFALPLMFLGRKPTTAGLFIAILGILIRAWGAGHLKKDQNVRLGGPYLFVRHPLYLGSCLLSLGLIVTLHHWIVTLVLGGVTALTYLHTIRHEEKNLLSRFGPSYAKYSEYAGPLWPKWKGLWSLRERLKTPHSKFSFRQYLKNKEYECLAGSAVVFALLYGFYYHPYL